MSLDFEKFAQKGNEFLNEIARELGHAHDKDKAGRKLRAILHGMRDQITLEESIQLIAQLPMFLKAIYVDNWGLNKKNKINHLNEFIKVVKKYDPNTADLDFINDDEILIATEVIFFVLQKYISEGEMEHIKAVLPMDLKKLLRNEIAY